MEQICCEYTNKQTVQMTQTNQTTKCGMLKIKIKIYPILYTVWKMKFDLKYCSFLSFWQNECEKKYTIHFIEIFKLKTLIQDLLSNSAASVAFLYVDINMKRGRVLKYLKLTYLYIKISVKLKMYCAIHWKYKPSKRIEKVQISSHMNMHCFFKLLKVRLFLFGKVCWC